MWSARMNCCHVSARSPFDVRRTPKWSTAAAAAPADEEDEGAATEVVATEVAAVQPPRARE